MYIPSNPKLWEEISQDKFVRTPRFWLPILIGLLIVYSTPEDVFLKIPTLGLAIELIAEIIPSVGKWGEKSICPSATLVLFSYFWILLPHYTIMTFKSKLYEKNFVNGWLENGWKRHFLPIISISFLLLFSLNYYFILPEDVTCRNLCIYKSKTMQFVYSTSTTLSIAGLLSVNLWWLKNFKRIHLSG